MRWDTKHDEICCRIYVNEIIRKDNNTKSTVNRCIALAKINGLPQPEVAIKAKFRNIKSICDALGLNHTTPFTGLNDFSKQCEKEFIKVYEEYLNNTNENIE